MFTILITSDLMDFITTEREVPLTRSSVDYGVEPLVLDMPLPNVPGDPRLREVQEDSDEDLDLPFDHIASDGTILIRQGMESPRTISLRLLSKQRVLEIEVMDLYSTENCQYRKVVINSQLKIWQHCFTLSEDPKRKELVVDFLTVEGFLYTLCFKFDVFSTSCSTQYTDLTGPTWRSIKFPAGFDIRIPHMMYAPSSHMLVVAVRDGSLIKLVRDASQSALGKTAPTTFFDNSKHSGGAGLGRLLGWENDEKIPGHPDISTKTVISMDKHGDLLATMSISRIIKIWSLKDASLLYYRQAETSDSRNYNAALSKSEVVYEHEPHRLLQFITVNGNPTLVTYFPLQSYFQFWKYNIQKRELEDWGSNYDLRVVSPDDSVIWLVKDFAYSESPTSTAAPKETVFWVLWASNNTSVIHKFSRARGDTQWKAAKVTLSDSESSSDKGALNFSNSISESDSDFFLTKFFNPGSGFTYRTIEAALPVFHQHFGTRSNEDITKILAANIPLKDKVCQVISAGISDASKVQDSDFKASQKDVALQWVRFDRLCGEIEKNGREVLNLHNDPLTGQIWLVKALSTSILRPLNNVEGLFVNSSSVPTVSQISELQPYLGQVSRDRAESLLRLVDVMHSFRSGLDHNTRYSLLFELQDEFSNGVLEDLVQDRMVQLSEYMTSSVKESVLSALATTLYDLGDLDSLLDHLLALVESLGKAEVTSGDQYTITSVGSQAALQALFQTSLLGRSLVYDMLILTLLAAGNESILSRFLGSDTLISNPGSLFVRLLRLLKAFTAIFEAIINCDDPLISHGRPFMELLLTEKYNKQIQTSGMSNDHIPQQIWSRVFDQSGSFYPTLACYMWAAGLHAQAIEYTNTYSEGDAVSCFLRGSLLLLSDIGKSDKAVDLLALAVFEGFDESSYTQIIDILSTIGFKYSKADFVQGPAILLGAIAKQSIALNITPSVGLSIAQQAAAALIEQEDQDKDIEMSSKPSSAVWDLFQAYFTCAVRSSSFDSAYNALVELHARKAPLKKLREAVSELVVSMAFWGQGLKLCDYPFEGFRTLVTDVLEEEAQKPKSQTSIKGFVPPYKVLYAWNIESNDYRGAAAALYNEITNAEKGSESSVLELYLSILNTLKSIKDPKDRWFLATSGRSRSLVKVSDVEEEYKSRLIAVQENLRYDIMEF